MLRSLVLLTLPMGAIAADPTPQIRVELEQLAERATPELLVVKMHADWCAGCRAIGDISETLQAKLEGVPAQFVTVDVTDAAAEDVSFAKARALGISDIVERNRGRIGVVLLIDTAKGEVLEMFTAKDGLERMRAGIRATVESRGS